MLTQSREEEIRHAGAVCGWFSGDWVPRRSRHTRRGSEALVILDDAVALVGDAPNLKGLIEGILERTESCVAQFNLGAQTWFAGAHQGTRAIEAVRLFAARVRDVQAVESVLFEEADGKVRVWTVMDEYDRDAEDRVYAAEARTLREERDVSFDFRILYRHGSPLAETRPASAKDA